MSFGLYQLPTKKLVPLQSVSVKALISSYYLIYYYRYYYTINFKKICDYTAQVTLEQVFKNEEKDPVEVEYIFPIDDSASIYR